MPEQTMNKADTLYDQLRREIGKRKRGERFHSVRGIMRQYGVSQSVVDRTLLMLRSEGLLVANPGSGMYVCSAEKKGEGATKKSCKEILLQVPRWPSTDIEELSEHVARINDSDSTRHVMLDHFDYATAVPRNLDNALRRSDGLVIQPASGQFRQADLSALSHYAMIKPTIVMGRALEGLQTGCVGLDNYFAAELAAHHLATHGHRRIGLLVSEPRSRGIRERVRGIHIYAKLHGLDVDLVDCNVASGELAAAKTYEKFSEVIRDGFRFTALVGVSGESIQGAINACHNHKVRIPDDLSVVAIAAERLTRISSPPLDTVVADKSGQFDAALAMIDRIATAANTRAPEEVYLQTRLIERGSVSERAENSL